MRTKQGLAVYREVCEVDEFFSYGLVGAVGKGMFWIMRLRFLYSAEQMLGTAFYVTSEMTNAFVVSQL